MTQQQFRPKLLNLTRFGDPVLRKKAKRLTGDDIGSKKIQELIKNIRYTNKSKDYGVGLAAPQVGESVALSVIGIKPTPTRPELEPFDQVIINPTYTGIGRSIGMWEACQSGGSGNDLMYAKASRYKRVNAVWTDENGNDHHEKLDGFVAHVFQHETDHLEGILFVDRVKDTSTYMLADEYRKRMTNTQAD